MAMEEQTIFLIYQIQEVTHKKLMILNKTLQEIINKINKKEKTVQIIKARIIHNLKKKMMIVLNKIVFQQIICKMNINKNIIAKITISQKLFLIKLSL